MATFYTIKVTATNSLNVASNTQHQWPTVAFFHIAKILLVRVLANIKFCQADTNYAFVLHSSVIFSKAFQITDKFHLATLHRFWGL